MSESIPMVSCQQCGAPKWPHLPCLKCEEAEKKRQVDAMAAAWQENERKREEKRRAAENRKRLRQGQEPIDWDAVDHEKRELVARAVKRQKVFSVGLTAILLGLPLALVLALSRGCGQDSQGEALDYAQTFARERLTGLTIDEISGTDSSSIVDKGDETYEVTLHVVGHLKATSDVRHVAYRATVRKVGTRWELLDSSSEDE